MRGRSIGRLVSWAAILTCASMQAALVTVDISHLAGGAPVQLASLRYTNAEGETFSFTRASYLLSGFAMERSEGGWTELPDALAWVDLERGRTSFTLGEVPAGPYRSLRFFVGVDATDNHADVAEFPANHPLNPNLNGLHWSWQGGYVFMALEGMWRSKDGELDGWSYHLAKDGNRTKVELPLRFEVARNSQLSLTFDLLSVLHGKEKLSFKRDGSSTHSREGDPIVDSLVTNLSHAFKVSGFTEIAGSRLANARVAPLHLPASFEPYKLEISDAFPVPALPQDNPLTVERVALGKKLFNETALSRDGSLSCASCHASDHAFSDTRRLSPGVQGRTGTRNAMPLFNLAWKSSFFWDGRSPTLRQQALMPIQDHNEMDEDLTNVVSKLTATNSVGAEYAVLFKAAFGSEEVSPEKIGLALECFLLTLTSHDSKFDRATRGEARLTEQEQRGLELFMTEFDPRRGQYGADCFHCHGGPLFQSQTFANNGLDSVFDDPGRSKVTGHDSDEGKFATPSLRNVALTAPYMHDGRFKTLEEVVEHYAGGVKRSSTLDPNIAKHPVGGLPLSAADKHALIEFLKTLTDPQYARR